MAETRRATAGPTTYLLRAFVVVYLVLLVAWPVVLVVTNTFANGTQALSDIFADPDMIHALRLSAVAAVIATAINTVFGVTISMLLVRKEFPGKRVLSALIDLPLSVSPIVVGLALMLVYGGRNGWFGPTVEGWGLQVVFATPGIVLATAFVSLPLVIREVVPVLHELGTEQEQAAQSLGASGWQTFWRITLPSIKWAVIYGVVLTLARSLGEFGAVKVVSGNVLGETRTATLAVEEKYLNFDQEGAYAVAFLLASVSVLAILVVFVLRARGTRHRAFERQS
ncbi:sulfate ABC transporter permease [Nocardioides marmotae]|uniref:Sulfate ABC transporter permease subunit n=1 Tax=Nocardioides marmotae TaxID=2663857 RepID=A0A6I3J956_9ACTN|nr:sulfate ABC transporter permease subunit [Nocardioides marmotae]MCR6030057.1 sulfate ABC transporter permease subunit [Gordonia jinghuaiqii]MBC9733014.1 sulfate ABC transporter permease [Nocardioides marmotae]MTB84128.1 sulfate ABC transporter permease subunit [Nocardioides marmotae]MTB93688.1 sulfate ABC transporter permease subunit [Nocardioides marmotae]QKE00035.1 sulfate ABC transporter permease [Nocardioides marmotae]